MKRKIGVSKEDAWERIKGHQRDPEFIRAAYEFIRYHTSHRRVPAKGRL